MRTFTAEDKAKITRIINEGIQVSPIRLHWARSVIPLVK
jgi:hypothetical protein